MRQVIFIREKEEKKAKTKLLAFCRVEVIQIPLENPQKQS